MLQRIVQLVHGQNFNFIFYDKAQLLAIEKINTKSFTKRFYKPHRTVGTATTHGRLSFIGHQQQKTTKEQIAVRLYTSSVRLPIGTKILKPFFNFQGFAQRKQATALIHPHAADGSKIRWQ